MIAARGASLSLIPFLIGSAVVHGTALVVLPGPAAEAPHLDIAASRPLRTTVTLPEPPPETPEAVLEPQPAATPVQRRRTNELPPPPPTPRRTESTPTPAPPTARPFTATPPPEELPTPEREPEPVPIERAPTRPIEVALEEPPPEIPEETSSVAVDVEPKPDAKRCPEPDYPLAARRRGWEGVCTVMVLVDEKGCPTEVSVHESSGREILDEAALAAVRGWWFEPAQREGRAAEGRVRVPVRFSLKEN